MVHVCPDDIPAHKEKQGPFSVFQRRVADIFLVSVLCIDGYPAQTAVHGCLNRFSAVFTIP